MKVLVIGSGAKEHAVTWAFSRSHRISALCAAPGNAGTGEIAENITDIDITNPQAVLDLCRRRKIDFVFCGTARSQASGVVDTLIAEGFSVFGAPGESARLETDRSFAKDFMERHKIPTLPSKRITSERELKRFLAKHTGRLVLKKNGLARYVRSIESADREELFDFGRKVLAEDSLIGETYREGCNLSLLALIDGEHHLLLPPASDYKKTQRNGDGVLTNGMGAVCPVPIIEGSTYEKILREIVEPSIEGLKKDGLIYQGAFFIGLLVNGDEAYVTSYHVRFGDPEAQVLIPLISSDFGKLMEAIANRQLDSYRLELSKDAAVGVVVAGEAYPHREESDIPVQILRHYPERDILIFHGATYTKNGSQEIFTNGRRSFTVVGLGENIMKANARAYRGTERIDFTGAWKRSDIGNNFFDS